MALPHAPGRLAVRTPEGACLADVLAAFQRLDQMPADVLQVVLDIEGDKEAS
ncbi:MAG: hypothetical protein U5K81_11915 [Trueperaceae bacterium]|nr:hypothetical protein [Trueperaceae bacterium]